MAPRTVSLEARSTDVFGRVLCSARQHHFVVDGPAANGCPGEALTPPEMFLGGVVACGVELLQVIARDRGVALDRVAAAIEGEIDPDDRVRDDVMVFNRVRLRFELGGVSEQEAESLVEAFKGR